MCTVLYLWVDDNIYMICRFVNKRIINYIMLFSLAFAIFRYPKLESPDRDVTNLKILLLKNFLSLSFWSLISLILFRSSTRTITFSSSSAYSLLELPPPKCTRIITSFYQEFIVKILCCIKSSPDFSDVIKNSNLLITNGLQNRSGKKSILVTPGFSLAHH